MKQAIAAILISSLLGSCASMFNTTQQVITVHTTHPAVVIHDSTTYPSIYNEVKISCTRSHQPLTLKVISDSLQKDTTIKAGNSVAYKANIFNLGVGSLADRYSPKRYSYPAHIYIDMQDSVPNRNRRFRNSGDQSRGTINLLFSLPYVNQFHWQPQGEGTQSGIGFWGVRIGAHYYYHPHRFVELSLTHATDFWLPVPVPTSISGEHEFKTTTYVSLTHNNTIGPWDIGYGLVAGSNTWEIRYYDKYDPPPPTRTPVKKTHTMYGLNLNMCYNVVPGIGVGIIYRPTVFKSAPGNDYSYEHLISLDFSFKFINLRDGDYRRKIRAIRNSGAKGS